MSKVRVLVVGCGNMGASHARAYHQLDGFDLVGLVSRGPDSRERVSKELGGVPTFGSFDEAMEATKPDAVSVNTYPDTHAEMALKTLRAGCHLFIEKPLAETVEECEAIAAEAKQRNLQIVVGYILRVHPAWQKFIEVAKTLGKPLVMRMNLNQQSKGAEWETHKALMNSMSPIVDCGVHYVDVMCQMTGAKPVRVNGVEARLSDELRPGMCNYGQLQVTFDDGSVGWYEAGWGPMMSETAYFIKDVIGPKGSVSIVDADTAERTSGSADIDSHTRTSRLKVHHAARGPDGNFLEPDTLLDMSDEPDHDGLCLREQELFLRAIRGEQNLETHVREAIDSLRIVLTASDVAQSSGSSAL